MAQLYIERRRLLSATDCSAPYTYGAAEITTLNAGGADAEKEPLLASYSSLGGASVTSPDRQPQKKARITVEHVVCRKHLGLMNMVVYIVGGVAGSGIFIAPTGVTLAVGSVGASLLIWAVCGAFNFLLAMCYSELGTAFPRVGGDYEYVKRLLGQFPAFLMLWVIVVVLAPVVGALLAQTASQYIFQMLPEPRPCHEEWLVAGTAAWICLCFGFINCWSLTWTNRLLTFFTICKLAAFGLIIGTGIFKLGEGYTEQFENSFEGSVTNPAAISLGFVPGFVSYVGWDTANALVEEMKKPSRDLPLSLGISMALVTLLYVLVNVAYFTVLTPHDFVLSDAVAREFALRANPSFHWVMPLLVVLSACGSVCAIVCGYSRFQVAGAQNGHMPAIFSGFNVHYFTPIPAITLQCALTIMLCLIPSLDLQSLLVLTGTILLVKMALALVGLIVLKCKYSYINRSVKVPLVLVIASLVIVVCILGLSLYQDPILNGAGLLTVVAGVPVYYAGQGVRRLDSKYNFLGSITVSLQRLFLVVFEAPSS